MEPKKITVEYLEKNKETIFSIIPELKDEDLDERLVLLLHDIGKPHSLKYSILRYQSI